MIAGEEERPSWTSRLAVVGIVTLAALAHARALASLVTAWDRDPMYSYGYLVLPITAWLVWARRTRLERIPLRPNPVAGGAVLACWLALMLAGRFGGVILFEQLGVVVALVGGVLALCGWRMLAAVAGPIAYLLLMVPFWEVLTEPLQVPFQNVSAALALPLLQAAGIPAFREGTFLTLPSARLEVARACSGVNYLIAVLALGLPMATLYLRHPVRRVVLVLSGLVIAGLSNALRVALIGILVTRDPDTPLHGPGHVLHGLFVAGIGYAALFAVLALLARGERRSDEDAKVARGAPAPAGDAAASRRWRLATAVIAIMMGTAVLAQRERPSPPVALAADLGTLPGRLGEWVTDPLAQPIDPRWWPSADRVLSRRYRRGALAADVYVGYFAAQRQSHEVAGASAEPLHRLAVAGPLAGPGGAEFDVNRVDSNDGPDRRLTVFWYDVGGRALASPTAVKLRTAWNAVRHDRTDGAVISVSVPLEADADVAAARTALDGLAVALNRALGECLPGRSAAKAQQTSAGTL